MKLRPDATRADVNRFRRFVRGSLRSKIGVRQVQRFVALGWLSSRRENLFSGFVATTWHVTAEGLAQLPGGKMP